MNDKIFDAYSWLQATAEALKYGEASIKIVVHDNQVRRIERTLTEREQ